MSTIVQFESRHASTKSASTYINTISLLNKAAYSKSFSYRNIYYNGYKKYSSSIIELKRLSNPLVIASTRRYKELIAIIRGSINAEKLIRIYSREAI